MRHWKIDRVERAVALDSWFTLPEDLDLEREMQGQATLFAGNKKESYTILLTDPAAQRLREDPWYPDQHLEQGPDDAWTLRVDASHPLEILPRLLSLGSEAQLLEPKSARDQMRDIVALLHDTYGDE